MKNKLLWLVTLGGMGFLALAAPCRTQANTAPSITNQPVSATNAVGGSATFSVTAGGTAPLAYQWFYSTNGISGWHPILTATNPAFTLNNLALTNAGYFVVIVTNLYGSVTSTTNTQLTVTNGVAPGILTQPVGLAGSVGGTATFSVAATGTAPLTYQWYYSTNTSIGWQPINNATNATFTLNSLQFTNAGYYLVIVANAFGQFLSTSAQLAVGSPPVINTQPVPVTNGVGSNAVFSATAGGSAPLSYQWYYSTNGLAGWGPLNNATNATLSLNNLQLTDAGYYLVIVTNAYGSVTSTNAQLAVWQAPVIIIQPASVTNGVGSNVVFSVTAGGTAPLTYQWYYSTNVLAGWGLINNATNAALPLNNLQATSAGYYLVIINNAHGSVISASAQLAVQSVISNTAPVFAAGPTNYVVVAGNTVVVTNAATDAQSPPQVLVYSLLSSPGGSLLDTNTGVVSWTTSTNNAGTVGNFAVVVTDNGTPALSATNSFTVTVVAVLTNTAPVFAAGPTNYVVVAGNTVVVTNAATDAQSPPQVLVYSLLSSPGGSLIDTNTGVVSWTTSTNNAGTVGNFAVVVTDNGTPAMSATNSFTVTVVAVLTNTPPGILVQPVSVTNGVGGGATFSVTASGTAPLTYQWFYSTNGINGWHPILAATNPAFTLNNLVLTNAGYYCVIVTNLYGTITSTTNAQLTMVAVLTNTAPVFAAGPTNYVVVAGNTVLVTNVATDAQSPPQVLVYSLLSSPGGSLIDTNTGVVSWTTSTNNAGTVGNFAVVVTDNGTPALSATNSFTVTVVAVLTNTAPVFVAGPTNYLVTAGNTILVTNAATDAQAPPQVLVYSLLSSPGGSLMDTNTGVVSWTTSTNNAGTVGNFAVVVTDNGTPALSATNSFTVTVVTSSNTAPVLAAITNRTVNVGVTVLITNVATDAQSPPQVLTFSLLTAPAGAVLNATNGVFSWRPAVAQANSTNLMAVVVADNGAPSLSATQSFTVQVNPIATPTVGSATVVGGKLQFNVAGQVGPDYEILVSTNLRDWSALVTNTAPGVWQDTNPPAPQRYYRVLLGP